jgi:hypothetical protein
VAGAEVQVILNTLQNQSQNAQVPHLSSLAQEKTVTDADGRWHLERFSGASISLIDVWATHPDYFTEPLVKFSGGNLEEEQKQLIANNYVYKLTPGIAARGMIVDAQGHPVSGAKVSAIAEIERAPLMPPMIVGQSINLRRLDHVETTNRGDGSFVLTGCRPGTNHLEVEAPGFALASQEVNFTNDSGTLRFVLQPGNVLRLRLLDAAGQPVTNGMVYPMFSEPGFMPPPLVARLTNGVSLVADPLLPAPRRSFHPDAEGRVTWESSPDAALQLSIQGAGVQPTNILVAADGQEHLVTLASTPQRAPHLTVTANVRDAASGQPIAQFFVATGNLDSGLPFRGWSGADSLRGEKFLYAGPLNSKPGSAVRFKFAADGYAPTVTRDIGFDERNVQLDIALAPRPSTSVTVLSPEGQPVPNADIGLGLPGVGLVPVSGGLRHTVRGNYTNVFSTDENGRFALPPDDEVTRVVAASPEGYMETTPAALAMDPVLRLQPWGRISGTMISGGKPTAGRKISVGILDGMGTVTTSIIAETDADGRFNFSKVPRASLLCGSAERGMGQVVWVCRRCKFVPAKQRLCRRNFTPSRRMRACLQTSRCLPIHP